MGTKSAPKFVFVIVALAASLLLVPVSRAAELKAEEVVARHLDAIGTAQARAAAKNRVAMGVATFNILVGDAGQMKGKATFVSEQRKLDWVMKFNESGYHGEQFICDGDRISVAFVSSDKRRSAFGDFVFAQDVMVREGLIGGVLSTAWPLLNVEERKAILSYEGLKKIDGHQVHDLRYRPQKGTDLEIHLYFDADTFRHIETVYRLSRHAQITQSPTIGGIPIESSEISTARQQEIRYRIEEKFSDFKAVDGLTLPAKYDLHFTRELQDGDTWLAQWNATFDQVSHNIGLDPRNFQVK